MRWAPVRGPNAFLAGRSRGRASRHGRPSGHQPAHRQLERVVRRPGEDKKCLHLRPVLLQLAVRRGVLLVCIMDAHCRALYCITLLLSLAGSDAACLRGTRNFMRERRHREGAELPGQGRRAGEPVVHHRPPPAPERRRGHRGQARVRPARPAACSVSTAAVSCYSIAVCILLVCIMDA